MDRVQPSQVQHIHLLHACIGFFAIFSKVWSPLEVAWGQFAVWNSPKSVFSMWFQVVAPVAGLDFFGVGLESVLGQSECKFEIHLVWGRSEVQLVSLG